MVPSRLVLLITFFLTIQSCSDSSYDVDISEVAYKVEVKRLDRDLFQTQNKDGEWLAGINDKYGTFSSIYFEEIMRIGDAQNPMTAGLAGRFTDDPTWSQLQQIIERHFPNLEQESAELEVALKRYAIHFKVDSLPNIVAYNSGYNVGIYPSEAWLGIGLEWYCGNSHPIIEQLPPDVFPQYKLDKMLPEYLVPNALKGYVSFKFREMDASKNLLRRMVHAGKLQFITAKLLNMEDYARVLNFTESDYNWCTESAYDIWKFLLENDLFFNEDPMQINKLMNDGPFTPGMPVESPGGVGNWVGLQMVKEYMADHPEVTLRELMKMENDRVFLEYYKFK